MAKTKVEHGRRIAAGKLKFSARVEARRRKVARMLLEGLSQAEIATALGYAESTISGDAQALSGRFRREQGMDAGELIAGELARVDAVLSKAHSVFEESADPAMGQLIIKAAGQRAKLLGLHDPDRGAMVEERERLKAALLDAARAVLGSDAGKVRAFAAMVQAAYSGMDPRTLPNYETEILPYVEGSKSVAVSEGQAVPSP